MHCPVAIRAILLFVAAGVAAPRALSQASGRAAGASGSLAIEGRVIRAENDAPAAFSTVEIIEPHASQFSNDQGRFMFAHLAAGRYHIRVRQLGTSPLDTIVTLAEGTTLAPLVLRIHAIPIRLSGVKVTANAACRVAQLDSVTDPALFAIVSAVRDNAERELLLRREYEFDYAMQDIQTMNEEGGSRRTPAEIDTVHFRSSAVMRYVRGGIVFLDSAGPERVRMRMRLPSMLDFADAGFLRSHCLSFAGSKAGMYDIAFRPLESIFTPDVEGTVSVDTASLVIRSAVVRLTRPWKIDPNYESIEAHTTYREILPTVVVVGDVLSTQHFRAASGKSVIGTEKQRTLSLTFLNRVPDGLAPGLTFR